MEERKFQEETTVKTNERSKETEKATENTVETPKYPTHFREFKNITNQLSNFRTCKFAQLEK